MKLFEPETVAEAVDRAELEQMLNESRMANSETQKGQTVQLYTPSGAADLFTTRRFADSFCDLHAGWTWKAV